MLRKRRYLESYLEVSEVIPESINQTDIIRDTLIVILQESRGSAVVSLRLYAQRWQQDVSTLISAVTFPPLSQTMKIISCGDRRASRPPCYG